MLSKGCSAPPQDIEQHHGESPGLLPLRPMAGIVDVVEAREARKGAGAPGLRQVPHSAVPETEHVGTPMVRTEKNSISNRPMPPA